MITHHDLLLIIIVVAVLGGGGVYYGYGRANLSAQLNAILGLVISVLVILCLLRYLGVY